MAASAIATFSTANKRALSERVVLFCAAIVSAIRFQKRAVLPVQNLATSVWKSERVVLVELPIDLTSLISAAYWSLVSDSGPAGRNWLGAAMTQGVMVANWGPAPGRKPGGVGRHSPTASPPRNGGGRGEKPSVLRQAMM